MELSFYWLIGCVVKDPRLSSGAAVSRFHISENLMQETFKHKCKYRIKISLFNNEIYTFYEHYGIIFQPYSQLILKININEPALC